MVDVRGCKTAVFLFVKKSIEICVQALCLKGAADKGYKIICERTATKVHMSPYSRDHHTAVVAPVSAVSPVIEEFGGNKKDDATAAGGLPPCHHKYSESGKPTADYTNGFSLLRRLLRWWLARFGQKPLGKKGTLYLGLYNYLIQITILYSQYNVNCVYEL